MNAPQNRGRSRRGRRNGPPRRPTETKPAPQGFFSKILALFGFGPKPAPARASYPERPPRGDRPERPAGSQPQRREPSGPRQEYRKPEMHEVTTPRLYVGNLSYDASESDLFELFNGVGNVQNAEVVTNRHTQRSKGFAFVQMASVEEAKRAVEVLHDKEFMGRKLLVSGAKLPAGAESRG